MILETICRRSHVAHLAPAVATGEIAYWGTAADYCSRKDKDGRDCEEAIVASRILMDSGRRIPVIVSPAPGATLRLSEAERVAHEPEPNLTGLLVDQIETVAQKLLDRGMVLDAEMAATLRRFMEQGGEKLPAVAALIRTAELDEVEIDDEEDEENGCWHYDYERFCTQCDPRARGGARDRRGQPGLTRRPGVTGCLVRAPPCSVTGSRSSRPAWRARPSPCTSGPRATGSWRCWCSGETAHPSGGRTLTLREAQWVIATDWFRYFRERVLR